MFQEEVLDSELTHEEIEEISAKYNLSWQDIFALDAQFWSLVTIESQEKKTGVLTKPVGPDTAEEGAQAEEKYPIPSDEPSISLRTFMNYTPSLADKFRDVQKRLISAAGLDTSNTFVRIEWSHFLTLKCFLELFTLDEEQLQDLWLKALDPRGLSLVGFDDMHNFLERLARGSMSKEPTEVSSNFAELMMRLFELESCFAENTRPDKSAL